MPVTVTEALRKGYNTVKLPSGLLFAAGLISGFVLHNILGRPGWVYAPSVAAGFLLSSVWWYWRITKWRIWAYENVDHIHEFEQKAEDAGYFGIFSDLLAIKTEEDKRKLNELRKRFKQKDVYEDDITVPAETILYFSKKASMGLMIFMGLVICFGFYLLFANGPAYGLAVIGIGGYFLYRGFTEHANTTPQVILNAKGIETAKIPFYAWDVIKNEKIRVETVGKSCVTYLEYTHPGGNEMYDLTDLEYDLENLQHVLQVCRMRSEKERH